MDDIIVGCINRDEESQKKLYNTFSKKMLKFCYRYTNNVMDAEDILQEGFVKVFHNISTFDNNGSFEGWIKRIMRNTALNMIRKRELLLYEQYDIEIESHEISPLEKIIHKESLRLLEKLPLGYKTVFNLYVFEDYSHLEISKQLKINESTSRTQFHKARKYLKKLLQL